MPRTASAALARRASPEARWWVFMRVSGVLLSVLVLGHLLDALILHDVADVDAEFLRGRWGNPFWRVWDGALLGLGLIHGAHGMRTVLEDIVRDPARRLLATAATTVVAGAALLLAAVTVLGV